MLLLLSLASYRFDLCTRQIFPNVIPTYLTSLARMDSIVKARGLVAAYPAQHRGTVEFWNKKSRAVSTVESNEKKNYYKIIFDDESRSTSHRVELAGRVQVKEESTFSMEASTDRWRCCMHRYRKLHHREKVVRWTIRCARLLPHRGYARAIWEPNRGEGRIRWVITTLYYMVRSIIRYSFHYNRLENKIALRFWKAANFNAVNR